MNSDLKQSIDMILAKLDIIERAVAGPSAKVAKTSEEAVLREKLDHLTIKRHAVLTATLSNVSYQELAKVMKCDVTTVKLHLKAALAVLGVASRSILLASHKTMLDSIPDKEYESRYGISRRWWLEQKPDLMAVLQTTKPTANQYKKEKP